MGSAIQYAAGDIFLVTGKGFFSKGIQFFTRAKGEAPTKVTHVGVVVSGGSPQDSVVVEALGKGVVRRPFLQGPGKEAHAVYRPLNISSGAIAAGMVAAHSNVGRKYGWVKIGAQVVDWLIPWRDKNGEPPYLARRFAGLDRYPFCSFLVDKVVVAELQYELREKLHNGVLAGVDIKADIEPFGVPQNRCTPDDIWDFVTTHAEIYECVRELGPA